MVAGANPPSDPELAYFNWCISTGKPYFGRLLAATQGRPSRHPYMRETVRLLAQGRRPLRILEVGSWAGGSAITFGLALKEFAGDGSKLVCVDPWIPYAFTKGNENWQMLMTQALKTGTIFQLFHHNLQAGGVADVTISIRGRSTDVLPLLKPESFDLIFIDGDHRYDFVKDDLAMSRNLVAVGGVISGDDLEKQLHDVDRDNCHAVRDEGYVVDPRTSVQFHPGVTLAVGEAFGPVTEREGFWATRRRSAESFEPFPLADLGENAAIPVYFARHPDFHL
jgi:predicted O-methyltransferase YrrM